MATGRSGGRVTGPACPRCQSQDLEPCDVVLDASGETVECNLRCTHCHTPFRHVPPAEPFNPPRFRGAAKEIAS